MNRSSQRRALWAWGGLASTMLVASVGCSNSALTVRDDATPSSQPVVRAQTPDPLAQNPDLAGMDYGQNVQYVTHEGAPYAHGEGTIVGGDPYAYGAGGAYCPPPQGSMHGAAYCPPGYGHGMGFGHGLGSRFTGHSHTYEDPGMPVYPAGTGPALTGPGSPGAIIQYPYYTTKGPDDFFLDEDGRY